MKVTIVGAGNVGASCAEYILIKEIVNEIVLLDTLSKRVIKKFMPGMMTREIILQKI